MHRFRCLLYVGHPMKMLTRLCLLLVTCIPLTVFACKLKQGHKPPSYNESYARADIVFSGKVVQQIPSSTSELSEHKLIFEVDEWRKGSGDNYQEVVDNEPWPCGYNPHLMLWVDPFVGRWIIFAEKNKEQFFIFTAQPFSPTHQSSGTGENAP